MIFVVVEVWSGGVSRHTSANSSRHHSRTPRAGSKWASGQGLPHSPPSPTRGPEEEQEACAHTVWLPPAVLLHIGAAALNGSDKEHVAILNSSCGTDFQLNHGKRSTGPYGEALSKVHPSGTRAPQSRLCVTKKRQLKNEPLNVFKIDFHLRLSKEQVKCFRSAPVWQNACSVHSLRATGTKFIKTQVIRFHL